MEEREIDYLDARRAAVAVALAHRGFPVKFERAAALVIHEQRVYITCVCVCLCVCGYRRARGGGKCSRGAIERAAIRESGVQFSSFDSTWKLDVVYMYTCIYCMLARRCVYVGLRIICLDKCLIKK